MILSQRGGLNYGLQRETYEYQYKDALSATLTPTIQLVLKKPLSD
jgi:hypothetical protein